MPGRRRQPRPERRAGVQLVQQPAGQGLLRQGRHRLPVRRRRHGQARHSRVGGQHPLPRRLDLQLHRHRRRRQLPVRRGLPVLQLAGRRDGLHALQGHRRHHHRRQRRCGGQPAGQPGRPVARQHADAAAAARERQPALAHLRRQERRSAAPVAPSSANLLQNFQGFLGQTNVIHWGKSEYNPGRRQRPRRHHRRRALRLDARRERPEVRHAREQRAGRPERRDPPVPPEQPEQGGGAQRRPSSSRARPT